MRTLVDTSSLIALARYYHPFDNMDAIGAHLQKEIKKGSLIVLDKVIEECKYVSQGLAYNSFGCLKDKKLLKSTNNLMPPTRFFNMLDNNFIDRSVKRLKFFDDESGYSNARNDYLKTVDSALIVYAMNYNNDLDPIQIMTEESSNQNDGKLFKKIPAICKELDIPTLTSVDYLKACETLTIDVR